MIGLRSKYLPTCHVAKQKIAQSILIGYTLTISKEFNIRFNYKPIEKLARKQQLAERVAQNNG